MQMAEKPIRLSRVSAVYEIIYKSLILPEELSTLHLRLHNRYYERNLFPALPLQVYTVLCCFNEFKMKTYKNVNQNAARTEF